MKFIQELKLGEKVTAQVIEQINLHEYIVSFRGDLMRIKHLGNQKLTKNEIINVEVISVFPLEFKKIADSKPGRRHTGFNISV